MKPLIPPVKKMIDHIRITRLKLGLSQSQLAKLTVNEVSQSFITKLENRRIKPSYQKIHLLCKALLDYSKNNPAEKEATAGEVCFKDVLFISPVTTIDEAIKLMRKFNYSQLPIGTEVEVVGSVTENDLLKARYERRGIYPNMPVKRVMGPAFPVIDKGTKVSSMSKLLLDVPAVLVRDEDGIIGIVTKIDLIM